jgi:hypothetical protein
MDEAKLIQLISAFYTKRQKELKVKYCWAIKEDFLPFSSSKYKGNSMLDKNIELKRFLNGKYKKADKKLQLEITKYYIYDWGHVHTNTLGTLKIYAHEESEVIINFGKKGVASWSKALTARDSKKFAIFDARVSVSLNGIIFQEYGVGGCFFPLLPSRNERIISFQNSLKGKINRNGYFASETFYKFYLRLIQSVANKCNVTISEIEMCLFTYAEEIALETFKSK